MSRVKLCEKKEKKHPPSLTLLFSLSCIPLSSCTPHPSHITLLVASVPAFFCALCTMFHFSSLECPPRGTVHPQLRVVCSRGGKSLSCVLLGISLPGTLKRANHCSHFKRYWIEQPTVDLGCESTVCAITPACHQTLSFVPGLSS